MTPRVFASPADAAREVAGVLRHGRALADVYLRGRLSADERERIMVAVSRVNACEGCTFVHERWALRAGATEDELRALELGDLSGLDARGRAAVVYASARAEARFRPPASADADAARRHLTPRELSAVEGVARAITLANLTVSTSESAIAAVRRAALPSSQT